jgi:hypothetical protein
MMSEKIDWTQKLGDAFLADQKKVLDTVQSLRAKAQASGNLQTTKEQTVIVEEKIIKIEAANPQVVYVPTYNPTVVYGAWPYPAYPPYYYYPPGYVASSMMWFGAGVAMGAAWGYAWGGCNWNGGDVDIDVDRNFNSNRNIDRSKHVQNLPARDGQRGKGSWQHNPEHRKGVSYRDQGTAQKFNRASTNEAIQSREAFRGRAEQGRQELGRGGVSDRANVGDRGSGQGLGGDRGGSLGSRGAGADSARTSQLGGSGTRGGAFEGVDRGGSSARSASQRGSASRGSFSGGGGRSGGFSGGGGRGGGGGGGRRR